MSCSFYAIELGRAVTLPDIALRTECDWVGDGAGKKGAFSETFALSAPEVAAAFYGGTLSAVEKRFAVYGRLTSGRQSWLGLLYCTSYGSGAYSCSFAETPREIWDEKIYRLATLPPSSVYNDIYSVYGDPYASQWCQPAGVSYQRCHIDDGLQPQCCLPRVRVDLVIDVINSMQGLSLPVPEWATSRWVYCIRGHVYSPDVVEGEEFDWEAVEPGSQYPLLWNLPDCTLYEFLSRLALASGFGTYVDGDKVSFVDYSDFTPSGAASVSDKFIAGAEASYGLLASTEGRIVTANGREVGNVSAVRANGTAQGVGDIATLDLYWSPRKADYLVADEEGDLQFADDLDTDAICVPYHQGLTAIAAYKDFLAIVARCPKVARFTLYGDGYPVFRPMYVPQLDGVYLPKTLTVSGGVTEVEGFLLSDYDPDLIAEWEYVFAIDEGEMPASVEFYATLGEPVATECGSQYPLLVTSQDGTAFAGYSVEFEWVSPTADRSWLTWMLSWSEQSGAEVEATEDGLSLTVTAQQGGSAIVVRPPLYAALRIRLTQLSTGRQEVVFPPFTETPITDYVYSLVGVTYEEPAYDDKGGAPTFVIKYQSHASQGCLPLPCDVELWPLGCNVSSDWTQDYDYDHAVWVVRSKAVWPSWGSVNNVPDWNGSDRTHYFGSYSPGVSFRLSFDGQVRTQRTDYYANSLFYAGRRAQGYWQLGVLAPPVAPYAHSSDGRWLVYDFIAKEWRHHTDTDMFLPTSWDGLPQLVLYPGQSMASRGDGFRVAVHVDPTQGQCYATGAQSGLTGPTCYLVFLDFAPSVKDDIYNSYDAPNLRRAPISYTSLATSWHAKWRLRYNSTASGLEDCSAYPPTTRAQGEGKVFAAANGSVMVCPMLIIDLSEGYMPSTNKMTLPLRVGLNNART